MTMQSYYQNYINGQFVDGGAGRLEVDDPADGSIIAEVALADKADIDKAVQAAKSCHQEGSFAGLRPVIRGRMVRAMGDYLLENCAEISELLSRNQASLIGKL